MANSGSFVKGQKRQNQGKRGPAKATLAAREAIALLLEANVGRLQSWLDEIAERDGPRAAFQCFSDLIEYHVPKLTRQAVVGAEDGPMTLEVRWLTSGETQA